MFFENVEIFNFMSVIAIVSGIMILIMDVKGYKRMGWKKERKHASFMAYFNIALGVFVLIGQWVYRFFIW